MIWLIAGLGIAIGGVGAGIRSFETSAAADIAKRLNGPAKQVSVKVKLAGLAGLGGRLSSATISAKDFAVSELPLFTEPNRTKKGRIDLLRLRLYNFSLRGLDVEELRADIKDCRYDLGLALNKRQVRLSRSGRGPGYARVNERALERFILKKYSEIKRISVRVTEGKLQVEGYGEFVLVQTNFSVTAVLRPRNGTQLWLENARVYFDGRPVEDGSERPLLGVLNPVIDENEDLRLYNAINIQELRMREGFVEILGETVIPDLPVSKDSSPPAISPLRALLTGSQR